MSRYTLILVLTASVLLGSPGACWGGWTEDFSVYIAGSSSSEIFFDFVMTPLYFVFGFFIFVSILWFWVFVGLVVCPETIEERLSFLPSVIRIPIQVLVGIPTIHTQYPTGAPAEGR